MTSYRVARLASAASCAPPPPRRARLSLQGPNKRPNTTPPNQRLWTVKPNTIEQDAKHDPAASALLTLWIERTARQSSARWRQFGVKLLATPCNWVAPAGVGVVISPYGHYETTRQGTRRDDRDRTSNPLWGCVAVLGGFDSYALPPTFLGDRGSWLGGAFDENETRFATFPHRLAELLDREALDGRDAAALDPAFASVVPGQMAGKSEVRRESSVAGPQCASPSAFPSRPQPRQPPRGLARRPYQAARRNSNFGRCVPEPHPAHQAQSPIGPSASGWPESGSASRGNRGAAGIGSGQ